MSEAKLRKKIKRQVKREEVAKYKADLDKSEAKYEFRNLSKSQRSQLHTYALEKGAVPRFEGKGNR